VHGDRQCSRRVAVIHQQPVPRLVGIRLIDRERRHLAEPEPATPADGADVRKPRTDQVRIADLASISRTPSYAANRPSSAATGA
jgi:hypothetical protein